MVRFLSNGTNVVAPQILQQNSKTIAVNREELQGQTLLTLTVFKAGCDDSGVYRCYHDNGQMSQGQALIISKFVVYIHVHLLIKNMFGFKQIIVDVF